VLAVGETTLPEVRTYLGERLPDRNGVHCPQLEISHSGRICNPAVLTQAKQLRQCGGVSAFVRHLTDLPHFQPQPGLQGVEDTAFAHSRRTAHRGDQAPQALSQEVDVVAALRADADNLVATTGVDLQMVFGLRFDGQVVFVGDDNGGQAVGVGGNQKAVELPRVQSRLQHGKHHQQKVDIGDDNLHLLRARYEPHHSRPARFHFGDDALMRGGEMEPHGVPDRHGVGQPLAPRLNHTGGAAGALGHHQLFLQVAAQRAQHLASVMENSVIARTGADDDSPEPLECLHAERSR